MEFELWYLIAVPILFAAGWWLRGVDFKQHKKATEGIDEHYAKGLSLLLSDDPVKADKAIDLFIEVVRLDPETIELHHALGNLFRRRGQFDRAIRLHSFLVNRAELPEKERALAMAELALDYLKSGMYDRAESAYEQLAGFKGREVEALEALMHIYCTEREWKKAVETAERLQRGQIGIISIHSPHTRGDSISLQKSIRIYVSLHNKTMIHRFSGLYKPLFCGAEPDIRGAKPTEKS